tara:strand:- start:227 stop:538 length:312 start_codon:yes stop_codon:yes gene_type:complete
MNGGKHHQKADRRKATNRCFLKDGFAILYHVTSSVCYIVAARFVLKKSNRFVKGDYLFSGSNELLQRMLPPMAQATNSGKMGYEKQLDVSNLRFSSLVRVIHD